MRTTATRRLLRCKRRDDNGDAIATWCCCEGTGNASIVMTLTLAFPPPTQSITILNKPSASFVPLGLPPPSDGAVPSPSPPPPPPRPQGKKSGNGASSSAAVARCGPGGSCLRRHYRCSLCQHHCVSGALVYGWLLYCLSSFACCVVRCSNLSAPAIVRPPSPFAYNHHPLSCRSLPSINCFCRYL
jgi:hypothetical protein